MSLIKIDLVQTDTRNRGGNMSIFPPTGLPIIAGMIPENLSGYFVEIYAHDMYCNGPYDPAARRPDILLVSSLTPGIEQAYQVGDAAMRCRGKNGDPIKVIIGGIHATALPSEVLPHANLVVRGELTADFMLHLLERALEMSASEHEVWRLSKLPEVIRQPNVRTDLIDGRKYRIKNGITTAVGCGFDCPFCSVTGNFGARLRLVDKGDLEARIAKLSPGMVAGYDDNFIYRPDRFCIEHAMSVADLLAKYGHIWLPELTLRTLKKSIEFAWKELGIDLLGYFKDRGLVAMFFGIETVGETHLKKALSDQDSADVIRLVNSYGILTFGAFVIGVDKDETKDKVEEILDFAHNRAQLGGVLASINTPVPGSLNFLRAVQEGWILHRGWDHYKGEFAGIRLPHVSPEELEAGLHRLATGFYDGPHVLGRIGRDLMTSVRSIAGLGKHNLHRVLMGAVGYGISRRWSAACRREGPKPIVEVPLRPEVIRSVEEAIRKNSKHPRLFDVNDKNDGISLLFEG